MLNCNYIKCVKFLDMSVTVSDTGRGATNALLSNTTCTDKMIQQPFCAELPSFVL